jgi:hypothetical protein
MESTVFFTAESARGLWAPLQGLFDFLAHRAVPIESRAAVLSARAAGDRESPPGITRTLAPPSSKRRHAARPLTSFRVRMPEIGNAAPSNASPGLRVLREFEAGTSPSCAGRMFISGRMADVCAELERMSVAARVPN